MGRRAGPKRDAGAGPRRRIRRLSASLAIAAALPAALAGAAADPAGAAVWAVHPQHPGRALPEIGRSLFDYEFTERRGGGRVYAVPFPFTALLERLRRRTAGETQAVLIPLGRSLQRSAAAPSYFASPRVVVAVTGSAEFLPGSRGAPWQDRLFLGYQARSGIIEVISYNESAARFEFQVVEDYLPGGQPRVRYVDRGLCMRCHQNGGPIFSRPLWDETNANPDVAARLGSVASRFHGEPARVGVDVPDAIDAATDRANLLAAYQRVWRDACGAFERRTARRCRGNLLLEALRFRLTGGVHQTGGSARQALHQALSSAWPLAWPQGLGIPDADIPNRRLRLFATGPGPLDVPASLAGGRPLPPRQSAAIEAALEPFVPRPPASVWRGGSIDASRIDEIVAGLASFLSAGDVAAIDGLLRERGAGVRRLSLDCELTDAAGDRVVFAPGASFSGVCSGDAGGAGQRAHALVSVSPPAGATAGTMSLRRLELPGEVPIRNRRLPIARAGDEPGFVIAVSQNAGLRVVSGDAVTRLALHVGPMPEVVSLEIVLLEDFAVLQAAVDELARAPAGRWRALESAPLRRPVILAELLALLGADVGGGWIADNDMPPAELALSATGSAGALLEAAEPHSETRR